MCQILLPPFAYSGVFSQCLDACIRNHKVDVKVLVLWETPRSLGNDNRFRLRLVQRIAVMRIFVKHANKAILK